MRLPAVRKEKPIPLIVPRIGHTGPGTATGLAIRKPKHFGHLRWDGAPVLVFSHMSDTPACNGRSSRRLRDGNDASITVCCKQLGIDYYSPGACALNSLKRVSASWNFRFFMCVSACWRASCQRRLVTPRSSGPKGASSQPQSSVRNEGTGIKRSWWALFARLPSGQRAQAQDQQIQHEQRSHFTLLSTIRGCPGIGRAKLLLSRFLGINARLGRSLALPKNRGFQRFEFSDTSNYSIAKIAHRSTVGTVAVTLSAVVFKVRSHRFIITSQENCRSQR